jgi:Mrp family chromosome partitioning ATPase
VSVVAFGSVRSCGVTTLVAGLAATWPTQRRVLLVEADPAGGTLAAASGWPAEPSSVSLAAAARRGGDPALVWEHCQALPGGASVLAAPAQGEQARATAGMLAPLLGRFGEVDGDVLIDCGRLDPASPALVVWERADTAVLVARPRLADLQALAAWLEGRPLNRQVALVTVGDGGYPDGEITEALGVEVVARLPWDADAAEALISVPASARQLRMAPLVRSVRTLADQLAQHHVVAVPAAERRPSVEAGRGGRAVAVGSRVLRAWWTDTRPHPNGSVPGEAGR